MRCLKHKGMRYFSSIIESFSDRRREKLGDINYRLRSIGQWRFGFRRVDEDILWSKSQDLKDIILGVKELFNQVSREVDLTNRLCVICDGEGIVLDKEGDALEEVKIGTMLSEEFVGVSGISASILLREPFFVQGMEHHFEPFKPYISCGSPVVGPDGEVMAVLGLFTPLQEFTKSEFLLLNMFSYFISRDVALNFKKKQHEQDDRRTYIRKRIIGLEREVEDKILKSVEVNLPVLITGETGVGKELTAEVIHELSGRKGPFIAVNCGAIPDNLVENELFGHEAGSFTGASSKGLKGKFELADGGTLFLDEIGELPLHVQAKLLRAIERKEFWKIGAVKPTKVDVKIIAATNRDLRAMVRDGKFRKDLYYRLRGISIHILPLRERPEIIDNLINYYLFKYAEQRIWINEKARMILRSYTWPGNVRELKFLIKNLVYEVKSGEITDAHVKMYLEFNSEISPYHEALERFEREYILKVLEMNRWNISKSARFMGISRRWLQEKIKRYGLK